MKRPCVRTIQRRSNTRNRMSCVCSCFYYRYSTSLIAWKRSCKIEGKIKEEMLPAEAGAEVASVSKETEMSLEEEVARWRVFSSAIGMEKGERRTSKIEPRFVTLYGYAKEGIKAPTLFTFSFFLFICFLNFLGKGKHDKIPSGCHVERLESTSFHVPR